MIDLYTDAPFTVFALTKNFKVKEVYITKCHNSWFESESGKFYSYIDLFERVDDATAEGWARLGKKQDRIEKQLSSMSKKRENLKKYEAKE